MPTKPNAEAEIKARKAVAGKFGFTLGCIAAAAAVGINLYRAPKPLALAPVLLALLMAALNVPLGIAIGLMGEWLTRPEELRRK